MVEKSKGRKQIPEKFRKMGFFGIFKHFGVIKIIKEATKDSDSDQTDDVGGTDMLWGVYKDNNSYAS